MRQFFTPIDPGGQLSAEQLNRLFETVAAHDRPSGMTGFGRGPRIIQDFAGQRLFDDTYQPFWARLVYKDDTQTPTMYGFTEVFRPGASTGTTVSTSNFPNIPGGVVYGSPQPKVRAGDQGVAEPGNWLDHAQGRFTVAQNLAGPIIANPRNGPRDPAGIVDYYRGLTWSSGSLDFMPAYEVEGTEIDDADILAGSAIVQMWLGHDSQSYYLFRRTAASSGGTDVGAYLLSSTSQTISSNTEASLSFDMVEKDTSKFYSSAAPTKITIPSGKGGTYLVNAGGYGDLGSAVLGSPSYFNLTLYKNGVATIHAVDGAPITYVPGSGGTGPPTTRKRLLLAVLDEPLVAGDSLQVKWLNGDASNNVSVTNQWFSIQKVDLGG